MSGGSYNYAYCRIEDLADSISERVMTPERKAFVSLLRKVAIAARDIEWRDSGDGSDEELSITAALGKQADEMIIAEMIVDAERLVKEMQTRIANLKTP